MATFQVSIVRKGRVSKFNIGGSLDVQSASGFNSKLQEEMKRDPRIMVISMQKLDYISSAGLGVLINAHETMQKAGHELRLCELNDKVRNIFKLLGFVNLFNIYESEKDATE